MSVLQRKELEGSPLADLHAIASELGIEGYRTLRKEDLIKALLGDNGDDAADDAPEATPDVASDAPAGGRAESWEEDGDDDDGEDAELDDETDSGSAGDGPAGDPVSGILDVLPNGSGFLRVGGAGGPSRDDVYVSPAQIRRCELRAGDEVAGPLRPPRRNERHPSLVRVETVNGADADSPEQRPSFDTMTPAHPTERLPAPDSISDAPFGKGSRVAVAGAPGAGATRLLRELASGLAGAGLSVTVALAGARPEELPEWEQIEGVQVTGGSFDASPEAQSQAAELAVEKAKRTVERGGDAVVVIDSLAVLSPGAQRRVFGAARRLDEGGSLTVIAAVGDATEPLRQASTRIVLESSAAVAGSGAQRADLLA